MYRWEYVKGQRAPKAVLTTDKTDGAAAADGQVHGLGLLRCGSGRLDPLRVELRRRLAALRGGQPDARLHQGRPLHGRPEGDRLVGPDDVDRRRSSPRATPARRSRSTGPIDGGLFSFGDKIQYKVTVTDPEDTIDQLRRRHGRRSCSATTRTATPRAARTGCTGFLQTDPSDVAHGGNVFGVVSATLHRQGRQGERAPTLTTTSQIQIRQKHQEVEHVVTQSGTTTATNTDGTGAGVHRNSARHRATGCSSTARSTCSRSTRSSIRYADGRPRAAPSGSPLAGDRHPSGLDHRSDHRHGGPGLDGRHRRVGDHDGPADQRRRRASTSCSSRSAPSRAARRAATCSTSTGSSSAATV